MTEIVFNPSGTLLVTASTQFIVDDGESGTGLELPDAARLWNTASGEQVGSDLLLTPAHRLQDFEPVANIEFTADGETLITSGPRVLRRWSIPSGELLVSTTAKLSGDRLPLFIQSWAALSEGRMFVATNLGLLVLDGPRLEPETDVALLNVSSSASGAIAANEGGSLVAFGGTSRILLWSPSGQQLLARVFPTGLPDAIGLPLDAYRLKTAPNTFDTRPPHYWDIRDPNPKPMQFAPKHYIPDATTTGGPDQEPVLAMTYFNPDDPPGHVELWDRQTLTDTGVRLPISGITAFDLDRGLVIGESIDELRVFDVESGEILERRTGFVRFDTNSVFNPDKTRLITKDGEFNATVWDTETWEPVHEFRADNGTGSRALGSRPPASC